MKTYEKDKRLQKIWERDTAKAVSLIGIRYSVLQQGEELLAGICDVFRAVGEQDVPVAEAP